MPNPNLQTAARYVRGAAQEKQQKISDLRQQVYMKEAEIRRNIDRIRTMIRQKVAEITRIRSDPNRPNEQTIPPARDIENLQKTITEEETGLQKSKQQVTQNIQGLEQQISSLNSQARNLEMGE